MPGCGKTTIGKQLAHKLNRQFVDTDDKIIEMAGKTIPDIFADNGETVFREWETKSLADLGKQSGLVIATGGGCVTQHRNYDILHQNGIIFWIQRDLNTLSTDGRPLSAQGKLKEMYSIREPMYQKFADHIINNDSSSATAVDKILSCLEMVK